MPLIREVRNRYPSLWLGVNFLGVTGAHAFPVLGDLERSGCVVDAYWADDAPGRRALRGSARGRHHRGGAPHEWLDRALPRRHRLQEAARGTPRAFRDGSANRRTAHGRGHDLGRRDRALGGGFQDRGVSQRGAGIRRSPWPPASLRTMLARTPVSWTPSWSPPASTVGMTSTTSNRCGSGRLLTVCREAGAGEPEPNPDGGLVSAAHGSQHQGRAVRLVGPLGHLHQRECVSRVGR